MEFAWRLKPLTRCTPRDARHVCCPNSLPLLGDLARLARSEATAGLKKKKKKQNGSLCDLQETQTP